ncbi:sugar ABC transporter ATP-binding protein [Rhodobacter sp. SY28-1]|uniref:sugar ABC transporter ATP-binding protein n=1 Tax=Rhodobacter sp. SY28-1 TaxID=2562317 RepID=UPI0010C154B9|nr:sugar ABC transporter ATP-binding protein [Rhodobacter sp. SY28-1]
MTAPLLEATGLGKSYGTLVALKPSDLRLNRGEVRALIGSNGAGKSTLIKCLTGAVTPSGGSVLLEGKPLPLGQPGAIIRSGVSCIYQHSNLAPMMSVMDNISMGRQPTRFGFVDRKTQRTQVQDLLARYGIDLDPDALVGTLPTVKQKEVEIAKALAQDAKVLLMDEPTGWLAVSDVRRLHETVRLLAAKGVGIIYISHMLDEIFAVCDSLTILRDGEVVTERAVDRISRTEVVAAMVGERLARESLAAADSGRKATGSGEVRLSVRGLGRRGVFRDISFDLHAGEILCITGLIGSKRTEMIHALFGSAPHDAGEVLLNGKRLVPRSPAWGMANGIGLVPEDRQHEGLMLGMPIRDNLVMTTLRRFHRFGVLRPRGIDRSVSSLIAALNVQPPRPAQLVGRLSGGNQQKVLIGKWLARDPSVLILDEPTVGVDVGAKAEIYALLRAARDRGMAVLVVSSDLEEVTTLADRIGVMNRGRLLSLRPAAGITRPELVAEIGADA